MNNLSRFSLILTFLISTSIIAQNSSQSKSDSLKNGVSSSINSIQAEQGDVKFSDGTNTLIRITDEGTFGALEIKTGVPSTTTDKLYNDAGTLKFNGSSLGGGSGVTQINDLTDAKYDGSSLFLGNGAGANDDAGVSDGSTNNNTAVGHTALEENTTGHNNTAVGHTALEENTDGYNNTSVGHTALNGNTIGYGNTAVGHAALEENTDGHTNTAVGQTALEENTTGAGNTAVGNYALKNNISGHANTSIGSHALRVNNSSNNVAVGYSALYFSTGENNTSIGARSLYSNTIGNNNVGIGRNANYYNQEGSNNTMIGFQSGEGVSNHNKSGNVFLGYKAGYFEETDNKLYINNDDDLSPLIWGDFANDEIKINGDFEVTGSVALGSNTTANGANSVAIGNYASTNNLSGSMILADNSTTTVLNSSSIDRMTMRFDKGYRLYSKSDLTTGVFMSSGANSWSSLSDSTKKENFQSVDGEELLNKISQFKLTTWNYKSQDPTKFRHYGPMAQDFYSAFGNDGIGVIGNDTSIASADFDGINLIAIQTLEKRTKDQDERIEILEKENEELKKQFVKNTSLEKKVEILEFALNRLIKEQPQLKISKK